MGRKGKRGDKVRFLKLDTWLFNHQGYRGLSVGARALHWELIHRLNGYNNGEVYLSHRAAAARLNSSRNTVAKWYKELEAAGWIQETRGHCLGPDGCGEAKHWELIHLGRMGRRPQNTFREIQKPSARRVWVMLEGGQGGAMAEQG